MQISSPATGLMIYQTDGTVGFYYYNGSSWAEVAATSKTYSVNTFYAELGGYVIQISPNGNTRFSGCNARPRKFNLV